MEISVQSNNCNPTESVREYLKLKLENMAAKYNWVMKANIYFKEEGNDLSNEKVIEISLDVPGSSIFSKGQNATFGMAAKKALEGARRQLRKQREKNFSY